MILPPVELTVADSATTSTGMDLRAVLGTLGELKDYAFVSLETPATLEAVAGALEFSSDNATYLPYYDDEGNAISITLGTSRLIRLRPSDYPVMLPYVRIVLGAAASGAARVLKLGLRKV